MNITIKGSKTFKEQAISVDGMRLTVGVRVYKSKELKAIRKEYLELLQNNDIVEVQKQMVEGLEEKELLILVDKLDTLTEGKEQALLAFYKKHIVFLKNISLETDSGDVSVPDTRLAEPIEGLWDSPISCLVVLLDLYFEEASIALLLQQAVTTIVFDASYKEEVIKN